MFLSKINKDNLTQLRCDILKNEMFVSEITDNEIKGTVNLDEDQFLFTTIPYDEGWQAYIDGKRVDVERTGDGFLALWPDAGEHDIVLRFVPEGFRLGIIISIAGWIIYIIVFVFTIKKSKVFVDHEYEKIYNQN